MNRYRAYVDNFYGRTTTFDFTAENDEQAKKFAERELGFGFHSNDDYIEYLGPIMSEKEYLEALTKAC